MPLSVRLTRTLLTAAAIGASLPSAAYAQKAERTGAPVAGTWGAEAGIGVFDNASLVKFLSPQWAALLGGSFSTTNATSGNNPQPSRTQVSVQAGVRRYFGTGLGFRPITGVGVSYGRLSDVTKTGGIYGEAGAAYFFNPHIAASAVGTLGVSRDGDQNTVRFAAPRVSLSIFF